MDNRSSKEQAKSGLRKGLTWLLAIAWGAMVVSGIGIVSTHSQPPIIGWGLLTIAAVVLVVTMDKWKKIIAGLLVYGAMNCFVSIFTGHVTSNFSVHVSPPQAIIATAFLLGSAALCFRFVERDLHIFDRIALFVLVSSIFLQAT